MRTTSKSAFLYSILLLFRIRRVRLLQIAFSAQKKPLSLTSAAGFLREKVRRASLGVEKPSAAFCPFCVAAAAVVVACLPLARGAFSLLCVSSNRFAAESVAAAAESAARPRRGGMVDKRRREKTKEIKKMRVRKNISSSSLSSQSSRKKERVSSSFWSVLPTTARVISLTSSGARIKTI